MQRGTFTGSPPTGISGMPVLVMDRAPDPMADRRPFWKVASVALAGGCGGVVACWSVGGASPVSSIDPAGMIGPALVGAALGVVATLACGLGMPRKVCWLFGATWGWMVSAAATMAPTDEHKQPKQPGHLNDVGPHDTVTPRRTSAQPLTPAPATSERARP